MDTPHRKHTHLPPPGEKLTTEHLVQGFRSRLVFERYWTDDFADFLTSSFGTITFLIGNAVFFLFWIAANTGVLIITPFDPFPFGFLTMVVSLEAIVLSIVVLISQNRQSKIADIRQQIDFEINVRSEEEISKMLLVLNELRKHAGIRKLDQELLEMAKKTDIEEIKREVESGEI